MFRVLAACLVGFLVVLSGCADSPPAAKTLTGTTSAAPQDPDQGQVLGVVVDEESTPLPKTSVALIGDGVEPLAAQTDAEGRFTFNNLPGGTFRLVAERLGYEAVARSVSVEVGAPTEVRIVLVAMVIDVAHYVTQQITGNVACSVTALYNYPCGEPINGVHWYPNSNAKHQVNWTVPKGITAMLVELDWRAQSDMAKEMEITIAERRIECHIALCIVGSISAYWSVEGPRVLSLLWDEGELKKFTKLPVSAQARVASAGGTNPRVIMDQKFTVYYTAFQGMEAPENFTAAPPDPM